MRCCFVLLLIACLCAGLRATRRSSSCSPSSPSSRGSLRSFRSYRSYRFRQAHNRFRLATGRGQWPTVPDLITYLTLEFAGRRIQFAAARKAGRSPLALRRKRRTYYRNFLRNLRDLRRQMKRESTRMGSKQPEERPDPQWFNRRVGVKPLPANMAWLLCRRSGQVGCGGDEGGNRARSGPGNDGKVHARGGVVAPLLVAAESKGKVVLKQSERQAGEGGFSWKRNIARGGQVSRSSFGKGGIIKPAVGLRGRKRLEGEAPIYTTWAQLLRYEAKARAANVSASGLAWNPEMTANGADGSFDDLFPEEGAGAGPPTTEWTAVSPTSQTGSTKPDVSTGSEGEKDEPEDDSEDEAIMVGSNVSEDEDEAGDDISDEIVAEDDELSSSEDIDDEGEDAEGIGDDSGDETGDEAENSSADADCDGSSGTEDDDEEGWISDVEDELLRELTVISEFIDDEEKGGGSVRGRFQGRKMQRNLKKEKKKMKKKKKKMEKKMKKKKKKKMEKKMKKKMEKKVKKKMKKKKMAGKTERKRKKNKSRFDVIEEIA